MLSQRNKHLTEVSKYLIGIFLHQLEGIENLHMSYGLT